jgi:hypothetical protein
MLHPECHESQCKEIPPELQKWICLFAFFQRSSVRENPGASAHRQRHESAGPFIPIARFANDPGNMQQQHE